MKQYPYNKMEEHGRKPMLMVIAGDPVQGFTLWGPFIDAQEAAEAAEGRFGPNGWTLIESYPMPRTR